MSVKAILIGVLPACLITVQAQTAAIEHIQITTQNQGLSWLNDPSNAQRVTLDTLPPTSDAANLFAGVVGFQADSRANYAQDSRLASRGFGSRSAFGIRGLRLLQDGIPLSAPDGQGQLSSVLLDSLASVEVLTGPMAALYGNASGGVVSFQSQKPQQDAVHLQLSESAYASQQSLTFEKSIGAHASRFQFKQAQLDSPRPHSSAEKQQAQWLWFGHYKVADVLVRYDWARDPYLEDPLGLTEAEWRDNPRQTAANATRFDTYKSSRQRQLSVLFTKESESSLWQLSTWTGKRQVYQQLGFDGLSPTSAGGIVDLNRPFSGLQGLYQWQWREADLSLGTTYETSTDERKGAVNLAGQIGELRRDEKGKVSNRDVYARLRYELATTWQLHTGFRASKNTVRVQDFYVTALNPDDSGDTEFNEQSTAVSLVHTYSQKRSWYLSAGQGFETPTLTEMAYQRTHEGLNLALRPSQSTQFEFGHKWDEIQWRSSLVAFFIQSKNEILVDQSLGGRTSYKNASRTERHGFEWLLQGQPSAFWQYQLSATWLQAKFIDMDVANKLLPAVAKHQLFGSVSFLPTQHSKTRLSLQSHYRSRLAVDDLNQRFAPSYVRFDLQWQAPLERLQPLARYSVSIDNLTDENYIGAVIVNQSNGRAFEPALPRQFKASIHLTF